CLDTSAGVYNPAEHSKIDEALKYTDLVMLDIKHIDPDEHKKLTGLDNKNILAFAEHLRDLKIPVWIRHVVVPEITDNDDELFRLGEYLSTLTNLKALDVLPYHDMAKPKYKELGIEYPLGDTPALTKDRAVHAREVIISGIKAGLKHHD
ncbi:MAG: radical SAM protein, partial [Ruminococcus sp.]|nr:radical SAM protein [Ruminococcus sp.]